MNFSFYLDNRLGEALQRLARLRTVSLIRKAVEDLVAKESQSASWSPEVLEWQGDPEFEPFESHRSRLRAPSQDPLA